MQTITGLDDFPTAIACLPFPLLDGRTVLACVHQPTPGTPEVAYAACYYVAGAKATKIGRSSQGKAIAVTLSILGAKLSMWVTEPPAGGSGAASQVDCYEFTLSAAIAAPDYQVRETVKNVSTALAQYGGAEVSSATDLIAAVMPYVPKG